MPKFECFPVPRQYYGERERQTKRQERPTSPYAEVERDGNKDLRETRGLREAEKINGEREG